MNIDRLNLRLKGLPAREARGLLNDLGSVLLRQLAQRQQFPGKGTVKIGAVDAGVMRAHGKAGGPDLRRAIADGVAGAVGSHLNKNITG